VTYERPARHETVTSQLHKALQGTDEESMNWDLLLVQEILRINEQHKEELESHEISIEHVRDELRRQ